LFTRFEVGRVEVKLEINIGIKLIEAKTAEPYKSTSATTARIIPHNGDFDRRMVGQISETPPLKGRQSLEMLVSARWWYETEGVSSC